ncbi:hypothetical protein E2C01_035714 [Portunus trituberculatus]|uniref:Uncharacterized protein n=1 Tax=Portunus trituberculatus TaxID=210409 RepID=A0A5B7F3W4_PORTR|nr:hypothetical protein [Portunus trituberculatus]
MNQWVEESIRYREEEEPLLLGLLFTKKPEPPPSIQSPMGRSDHMKTGMALFDGRLKRKKIWE